MLRSFYASIGFVTWFYMLSKVHVSILGFS